jgi:hypothetical protein
MACAKCDFSTPKNSSKAQLIEAKDNLQRMLAAIPLTDDERAAVGTSKPSWTSTSRTTTGIARTGQEPAATARRHHRSPSHHPGDADTTP